ncbi:MAG TPA: adenine phosphoribosyltransferase [Fibrobacteria bacterium]|nr:adenine phosphoribosyltransferase [Fibrobacteria bacterium]
MEGTKARPAASGAERADRIRSKIRSIPDFPKPGIVFRDITTLWNDSDGFRLSIDAFAETYGSVRFDSIVGIESRGFIIGAALADRLGKGFIPIRKQGKLPAEVERYEYQLEYGSDCVEIHKDAIIRGQRVVLMDDLMATGGTMNASIELLRKLGAEVVSCGVIVDLPDLGGSLRLRGKGLEVVSLVAFPGH